MMMPLTIGEIHRGMAVWLEFANSPDLVLAIGGSSAHASKCFITESDINIALRDDEYGVVWRCWTSLPTDADRKAAVWTNG